MEETSLVADSGIVNVKNDNFEWVSKIWNGKNGLLLQMVSKVKLGNKERFYREQIGIKEPFPMTNLPFMYFVKIRNFWH